MLIWWTAPPPPPPKMHDRRVSTKSIESQPLLKSVQLSVHRTQEHQKQILQSSAQTCIYCTVGLELNKTNQTKKQSPLPHRKVTLPKRSQLSEATQDGGARLPSSSGSVLLSGPLHLQGTAAINYWLHTILQTPAAITREIALLLWHEVCLFTPPTSLLLLMSQGLFSFLRREGVAVCLSVPPSPFPLTLRPCE